MHVLELNPVFHHLPSVGPKQLYSLAHLGYTHAAGTSEYYEMNFITNLHASWVFGGTYISVSNYGNSGS